MKEINIDRKLVEKYFPKRSDFSNKYDFGRVLFIAGSNSMSGACVLSSKAVLRSGAGLLIGIVTKNMKPLVSPILPEAIFYGFGSGDYIDKGCLNKAIELHKEKKFDLMLIGPGLGNNLEVSKVVIDFIKKLKIPSVIDADAINSLSKEKDISFLKEIPSIITPHTGEARRLSKSNDMAMDIAKRSGGIVVLKDFKTVITDGEKKFIMNSPNSALSKAGSGDVLSGIITGIWAQMGKKYGFTKETAIKSAVCGVYVHSLCGLVASKKLSKYSVLASDIIEEIPTVLKDFEL